MNPWRRLRERFSRANAAPSSDTGAALLAALPWAAAVLDRNANVLEWNPAMTQLWRLDASGTRRGESSGAVVGRLVARGDYAADSGVDVHADLVRRCREGVLHTTERRHSDGRRLRYHTCPLSDGRTLLAIEDLTELDRSENALRLLNDSLESRVNERTDELIAAKHNAEIANLGKARFLVAASHDLFQPIGAARLLLATIRGDTDPKAFADRLASIDAALASAEEVIASLVDAARLDSAGVQPNITSVACRELLRELVALYAPGAQRRGLDLRLRARDLRLRGDPVLLRRVIGNLLSNALRYTRSGGVLVGVRVRGDTVAIEVWDTGVGISDNFRGELFREFRRGPQADAGELGLGLGLAIAQRFAGLMGSEITVRSRPGRGSVFGIALPRLDATAIVAHRVDDAGAPADHPDARVLVVEDDEYTREAMATLLRQWGYDVDTIGDPLLVRERARRRPPHLILADFRLGESVTGIDVLLDLRVALARQTPGILITATRNEHVTELALKHGFEVVLKPFQPAVLRGLIARSLASVRRPRRSQVE